MSKVLLGQRELNPCRFLRANERPCCVEILENTQVFPAAFALPARPFAPQKLRSTRARAKIEGFLHRQGKPGLRPASAKEEKALVLATHGRYGFDSLRPKLTAVRAQKSRDFCNDKGSWAGAQRALRWKKAPILAAHGRQGFGSLCPDPD